MPRLVAWAAVLAGPREGIGGTAPVSKRTVLIIDDDAALCESLRDGLAELNVNVICALNGQAGLEACRRQAVQVVLLDQHLPDGNGLALCPAILGCSDRAKIIFMTAFPSFDHAVGALRAGASDYLAKPFDIEEVFHATRNALRMAELEDIEQLHGRQRTREIEDSSLVGSSLAMREALHLAALAARANAPVLITGETGTGKTRLARHIHYAGVRRTGPFVSLNCAALPESLAESELFGHERGSFTGATGARRGIFELADGGTALLDEIGTMPVHLQPKLLGVLEEGTVRRVGGESSRRIDTRIIAASNADIERAMEQGTFRRDLYYRLSVVRLHIPALRERVEDIPELCRQLTRSICGHEVALGADEERRLAAYQWPGNVRELRNVLERALLIHDDGPFQPSRLLLPCPQVLAVSAAEQPVSWDLAEAERRHIERALASYAGNYSRTARALGVALSTLKRKAREYGIQPPAPSRNGA